MELEPNTVIDRYRVGPVLGRGGMAIVYKVEHEVLGSTHALKLVFSPKEATRERLMQEGRAQSQLRHRNIVAVTDVIWVHGAPGLVLEYIDGPSLEGFLASNRLTVAQADALARGILAGVAAAHAAGVLHRDLKPANVLLAWEETGWVAKLADDERIHQTRTGAGLGTPMYMAPEQTRDASRVDERADVFSMGAMLYELVCGKHPFTGRDLVELFGNIRAGTYAPLDPSLPARMREAITGALEPDLERRWPSITALATAWIDGTPADDPAWKAPDARDVRITTGSASQASQTFGFTAQPSSPTIAPMPDELASIEPDPEPPFVESGSTITRVVPAPGRARQILPVLLALGLGIATAAWWSTPTERSLGTGELPTLFVDESAQRAFERAWTALLDADFIRAEQAITGLTERPDAPAAAWAVLAMVRAGQEQVGPAHQAMWKAVELAEGGAGVHAEVLQLQGRARRKGWTEVLPAMRQLAEAHPDDVLVQWVASWTLPPDQVDFARANAARMLAGAPGVPYPSIQVIRIELANGDRTQAARLHERATLTFPDHPVLHVLAGQLALGDGDLPRARAELAAALKFAPGLYAARHQLAEVTLLLGDADETQALIAASLAPSEPTAQRSAFSYRMGLAFSGLGRVREGSELLRRGAELARVEGDHLTRSWLLGTIALVELDAGRFDIANAHLDELLAFAATTPELPEGERASMSRGLLEARAFVAARKGDVIEAEALLKRMEALEGVRASSVEWVKRDLASHRHDVAALDGLFEHAQPGCQGDWERARALALAGDRENARARLEALLAGGSCGPVGADRWANALAYALAAELTDDPAARATHLAGFARLWPAPDADLPVVQRVAALHAPTR